MQVAFTREDVKGWLHEPSGPLQASIALTHGAGSDCDAPFLVAAAEALSASGYAVLRYDLPFRQQGHATLNAAQQARDREGIKRAARELRQMYPQTLLVLAGHSYGGRQSSMAAAEAAADALVLLSYPLHPPRMPEKLRTDHFPSLRMPTLFVHGTRDPFGSIDELKTAIALIPGRTRLEPIEKGGHNLPVSAAASLPLWLSTTLGG